jgi:uncharacterized protein YciI
VSRKNKIIFVFIYIYFSPLSNHYPKPLEIMWGNALALGRASAVAFMAASRQSSYSTSTTTLAATQYLLRYDYIPDVLEKRGPFREGHIGLAKQLAAEGKCLSGGPTGEPGMEVPTGALFIFSDEAAANLFVKEDPYVSGGIVTGHSIEEWNVVIQTE